MSESVGPGQVGQSRHSSPPAGVQIKVIFNHFKAVLGIRNNLFRIQIRIQEKVSDPILIILNV